MTTFFISTAIPYVNARPHIGFAMELVLADVMARHARQRGDDVWFQTGSDENSLKNVRAAEAEGIATETLVSRNAAAFRDLQEHLDLSWNDFVRTSTESRHRDGVRALWRACDRSGDIYRRAYRGLYCVGCEQFYADGDLTDGRCPEHGTAPELVDEENYFFRLSRYQDEIERRIESGALRIEPEQYRAETLAFVRSGLQDFSISRSRERAHGWGIAVPGDEGQVMYVWFDALGNYITAPGYANHDEAYERYWVGSAARVHVIGKGVTRFHAVYWPAMLLSAGLPLPSLIAVHGYLTVDGAKISKSADNSVDPIAAAEAFGSDALRYYLCRHFRFGQDGNFSAEHLRRAVRTELADQLGNLLQRTVAMLERYCAGRVPASGDGTLRSLAEPIERRHAAAFDAARPDLALRCAWELVEAANAYVVERAPWRVAKRDDPTATRDLTAILGELAFALRTTADLLHPFTPKASAAIHHQIGGPTVNRGPVLFPKD